MVKKKNDEQWYLDILNELKDVNERIMFSKIHKNNLR